VLTLLLGKGTNASTKACCMRRSEPRVLSASSRGAQLRPPPDRPAAAAPLPVAVAPPAAALLVLRSRSAAALLRCTTGERVSTTRQSDADTLSATALAAVSSLPAAPLVVVGLVVGSISCSAERSDAWALCLECQQKQLFSKGSC